MTPHHLQQIRREVNTLKRFLWPAIGVIAVLMVASRPSQAADLCLSIVHGLASAADGFVTFLTKVAAGI